MFFTDSLGCGRGPAEPLRAEASDPAQSHLALLQVTSPPEGVWLSVHFDSVTTVLREVELRCDLNPLAQYKQIAGLVHQMENSQCGSLCRSRLLSHCTSLGLGGRCWESDAASAATHPRQPAPPDTSLTFFFCYRGTVIQQLKNYLGTQAFVLCKALCMGVIIIVTVSSRTLLIVYICITLNAPGLI